MSDFDCPVCGSQHNSEWREWKGYPMCMECQEAMQKQEQANEEALRFEFFQKHYKERDAL